ncbi:penicillin-binding protein 1A [Glacieibacterium frigidum]|uniref:penicillin-binding protein 1A n=1 Tax=Glacieibacterium frigidum TaxID=2593303 RepID=UPI001F1CCFD7|nr:PBP1A family penicillin-binding protein [Glacieibacterium frigidum]
MTRTRKILAWGAGGVLLLALLVAGLVWTTVKDLPDVATLAKYTPPLPSTVRAADGTVLTSFTRERRIYLNYNEIPPRLVQAYLSAEDKTFFEHHGLDYAGIAGAVWTNLKSLGTDKRPVGASTITQQVAKNLLLNNEVSLGRKLKEAVLAWRLEEAFSKAQILELYLNQIFLGRNSYGVEAAAQAYFGKSVANLDLAQMAYLAILPKAPSTYSPTTARGRERALARRNYVLRQMVANGYVRAGEAAAAEADPLVAIPNVIPRALKVGDYFLEDVRRSLIAKFGEAQEDGPNSVYGGGLWVRTSIDPTIQAAAEKALRDGLVRYEAARPWRGPAAKIEVGDGWQARLRGARIATGYPEWQAAVVLSKTGDTSRLGFGDGSEGTMPEWAARRLLRGTNVPAARALKVGDVIPVAKVSGGYALRQVPEISGGMVVQDPKSGRILAMVGGFDARAQAFNRATQALRQPGSAFKPIVYATALDNGFTPSSIIVDAPYCVFQTRRLGRKCFRNFTGGYAGAQTMRWGLEQSRNLMTVRLGFGAGMDKVVKTAEDLGIGKYPAVLAISLGAGETTVLKLTNAYAQLWNGGRKLTPSLIDWVQDRNGKTLYRADTRSCEGCEAADWTGGEMPRPGGAGKQVVDARTAYQIVHLMEGVVQRGTAMGLSSMNRPLAGKTGTTSGPNDVWFIGGTPELVAGLYLGYDRPRSMGGYAQGGTIAVPIWRAFGEKVLKDAPKLPFAVAPGIRMVTIDRRSGKRVYGANPSEERRADVIWEAFKPASEPRRTGTIKRNEMLPGQSGRIVRSDSEFLRNSGGIY